MNRSPAEFLNFLPSVRELRVGAATLVAAFSIHTGRLSDTQHNPLDRQALPGLLTDGLASGGSAIPQIVPGSGQLGQQQEALQERNVPPLIQRYINHNTVVIMALRCSGTLLRNTRGVPKVALTAGHCVNDTNAPLPNPLFEGNDGKEYMVSASPIAVQTGIDVANLHTVGNVQEFVVPSNNGSQSIDQGLALFPGTSPREGIRYLKREMLSQEQISSLKPNKAVIWTAGFPYTSNGDSAGNIIREELGTTYIGTNAIDAYDGSGLEGVLTATDKTNSNGATCSWGWSGGGAEVEAEQRQPNGTKRGVVKLVGDFTNSDSFTPLQEKGGSQQTVTQADANEALIADHVDFPHANWKGVAGTCDSNYQPIGNAYQVIRVVPSTSSIPAPAKALN